MKRIKVINNTAGTVTPEAFAKAVGAVKLCKPCGDFSRRQMLEGNPQQSPHRPCTVVGCGCRCHDADYKWSGVDDEDAVNGDRESERFLINVGWASGAAPMVFQGRISADTGLPIPTPPPTADEMAEVAYAAKRALLRVLRTRKKVR